MTLADFLTRLDAVQHDDGWLAHCPAHADTQASLRVAVAKSGKVLVKCRAGCETFDVMAALGLSLRDLASMQVGDSPVPIARAATALAGPGDIAALRVRLDAYADQLSSSPEACAYAADRFGLSPDDMVRLGLGYADNLGGGPRLVVPFCDRQGVAHGFQARALDPDANVRWLGPRSPEGATWSKVGFFPGLAEWQEVLITEGPGDGLTGAALGYDTVGVRGAGMVANPAVVDEIEALLGDESIPVIVGDADASGERFSDTLAAALLARGRPPRILDLPGGVEDLTAWRERDPNVFTRDAEAAIRTARPARADVGESLLSRWGAEFLDAANDVAGARILRDHIEQTSGVRFSPEAGFFLLRRGVWRPDRLDYVRTLAHQMVDRLRADLDGYDRRDNDVTKAVRRYTRYAQTTRGLDAMLRELRALPGVAVNVNDFDQHPDRLAVRNGVIDLRTGDLLPHDPALLLTRRIDLTYDPAAEAPRWLRFLDEVFPAYAELPDFIRRLVGYGITGATDEQCFAVLWGKGANGKSVFTDTLTDVFRELTVTTPFSTFEERGSGGIPNDIAALKGARLVMAAEGEQGRPMSEAVLKRVTGRDLISARFMRREFFEFRPTFLLLLATNFKPKFRGQDEGLWRRVKLVPWDRYFAVDERDYQLAETLRTEAPGILAWAVRGATEWYAHGLKEPRVVIDATREYRETSDALSGFLPGAWTIDPDARDRVLGATIFDAYLKWAEDEHLPLREVWTRRTFYDALEERGAVKRKVESGAAFEGIRKVTAKERAVE